MSEHNYRRMKKLGITGSYTNTCYAAAADRCSKNNLSAESYVFYERYIASHNPRQIRRCSRQLIEFYELLAEDFELPNRKEIDFLRLNNRRSFVKNIGQLLASDYGVVVDLVLPENRRKYTTAPSHALHSVALIPHEEHHVFVRSTWTPGSLRGPQSLDTIFDYLHVPSKEAMFSPTYPFNEANTTIIPRL